MSTRQPDQFFVTDRSCTDILSLIVLIGLVIGFVRSTLFRFSFETTYVESTKRFSVTNIGFPYEHRRAERRHLPRCKWLR